MFQYYVASVKLQYSKNLGVLKSLNFYFKSQFFAELRILQNKQFKSTN